MTTIPPPSQQEDRGRLADELRNFEEIARLLKPSPGDIPRLRGVDIHGLSLPLQGAVGGDHIIYVDFSKRYDLAARIAEAERAGRREVADKLRLNRRRAGILLVDVSGHRVTDSLVAAMLHQAFLLGAYYELDVFGEITTKLFEQINTRFYRSTSINRYFTMVYGEISDEGRFRFLTAGHPRPMVFSREFGRFVEISKDRMVSFPPVGMFPSSGDPDGADAASPYGSKKRYKVNEIDLLSPGDILLLYTDGLAGHDGGRYFPSKVERLLAEVRGRSAAEICDLLRDDLISRAAAEDDISFVVIQRQAPAR
jgi:serine phosphatase RsbU (regulator of sigma subunit)